MSFKLPILHSDESLLYVRFIVTGALLVGMLMTPHLWLIQERTYPLAPVFPALEGLPWPVQSLLAAIVFVLSAAALFVNRSAALCTSIAAAAMALLCLIDLNRLQPWVFQYFSLALICVFYPYDDNQAKRNHLLSACRIALAGTYFYSGMHKLNPVYLNELFGWFVHPIMPWMPHQIEPPLAMASASFEILLGIALLFSPWRRIAAVGCILMHLFIMVCLGPQGHNNNFVIWPWNIAMVSLDLLLFILTPPSSTLTTVVPGSIQQAIALIFFFILPAGSFFGLWDQYLSANLYGSHPPKAVLCLLEAQKDELPQSVKPVCEPQPGGTFYLPMYDWGYLDLNVPPYPETRTYLTEARLFVRDHHFKDVSLLLESYPRFLGGTSTQTEHQLDSASP